MKVLRVEHEAPDFSLPEFVSGKPVSLRDYLGKKVVMLEFWATWCDICKSEMPRLQKEYAQYKDKGYELLAITLSSGDKKEREKIQSYRDKYSLTYLS